MNGQTNRRDFFKRTTLAGAGALVVGSRVLASGESPNEKLNIGIVGVAGRGAGNANGIASENIVALCDVDDNKLAVAAKRFPNAKTHNDWRKMLDQKDLDAVVCSTTEHTHALVSVGALRRELHVYCEKPIAHTPEEAQAVRQTYLKVKNKVRRCPFSCSQSVGALAFRHARGENGGAMSRCELSQIRLTDLWNFDF